MKTCLFEDSQIPHQDISFTFDHHQNQLTITANSSGILYQTNLILNSDIQMDEVKKTFELKEFKIVSKSVEFLKLKFGFFVLEFRNRDKIDLQSLKGNVVKFMHKLQEQLQSNGKLENLVRQLKEEVDFLTQNQQRLDKRCMTVQSENFQLKLQLSNCNQKIEILGNKFDKRLNLLQANEEDRNEVCKKEAFKGFFKH